MSVIGPDLPPHLLAKRKRQQEAEEEAFVTASGANSSATTEGTKKRRKILGPAMPPAPPDERPNEPPNTVQEESSDDDDDFGPALPTEGAVTQTLNKDEGDGLEESRKEPAEGKQQRDDWMMIPPEQDDLAARMDPTRQRPKAFNTGKTARGPNNGENDHSTWHETPEQKQKRLQDEVMGIGKSSASSAPGKIGAEKGSRKAKDDAARRKIQEYNGTRGPSLLEQYKQIKGDEAEDDPSKRAFDREKDMASGSRVSSSQKREMLNKAAGFSGKFSGGSYL